MIKGAISPDGFVSGGGVGDTNFSELYMRHPTSRHNFQFIGTGILTHIDVVDPVTECGFGAREGN